MNKRFFSTLLATLVLLGSGVLVAHAYVPLVDIPGVTYTPGVTKSGTDINLSDYLMGLFKFIIAFGGALAIFMAIVGGTQYVAATINPAAKGQAKERVQNALIGLALVLSSYLLLNSINPELTKTGFNLPVITSPAPEVGVGTSVLAGTAKADALNLAQGSAAYTAALELALKYPNISFTSGKRSTQDQARAMAQNVAQNRQWIVQTYKQSAGRDILQAWVNNNPNATTVADIQAGLLKVMQDNPGMTNSISKHLTGNAFDINPDPAIDPAIVEQIVRQNGATEFFTQEGGITIWHAGF